jgi:hypothetical protein
MARVEALSAQIQSIPLKLCKWNRASCEALAFYRAIWGFGINPTDQWRVILVRVLRDGFSDVFARSWAKKVSMVSRFWLTHFGQMKRVFPKASFTRFATQTARSVRRVRLPHSRQASAATRSISCFNRSRLNASALLHRSICNCRSSCPA